MQLGLSRWLRPWVFVVVALALLGAACGDDGGGDGSASSGTDDSGGGVGEVDDIRILMAVPLTGDSAETGNDMVHGAELAAEYLNEQGGVQSGELEGAQFVIESADDELSTDASTTIASRYADDEGIWTMGGFLSSGQAQAAGVVAQRAGLSVFSSFSCADFLTEEADNIVVICGSLDTIAAAATDFAISEFEAEQMGTIAGDYSFLESYYSGVDRVAEEHGVQMTSRQIYPTETADFSTLITNMENDDVDVILSGAFQADAGRILSQARQAGIDVPFVDFLGEGWGETFFDTAGDAASQDVYGIDSGDIAPEEGSFVEEMSSRYEEEYGKRMSSAAMHAFDTVLSVNAAIEAGATSREDLLEFIGDAEGDGILGPIDFNEELRPVSRIGVITKITGDTPNDREVAARYELHDDNTVERVDAGG